MKRMIAAMLIAAGAVLAAPMAAQAAPGCDGTTYNLTVSQNTAAPGATVTVTACLDAPSGTVASTTFSGHGVPGGTQTGSATVDPGGLVTFPVQLPTLALDGDVYTVGAAGGASSFTGTIRAVRLGAADLPSTGVEALPWLIGGGALVVAGGAAFGIGMALRRRRATAR
jgi:hypothetical protein